MANPSWTGEEMNHHNVYSTNESSSWSSFMKHNAGIALSWDPQEQAILDDGLARYSLLPILSRYLLIASDLREKTVRDVAVRCKWLNNKEISKRRNEDHNGLVNSTPASHLFETSPLTGEEHGVLLKKNEQIFNQISANLTPSKLMENLSLFSESLANIETLLTISNENVCELMKRMPSLPVKLNSELWNAVSFQLPNLQYNDMNDDSFVFSPYF